MKPEFKQTEVGVIPEDWELAALGDQFNFSGGFAASRAQLGTKGHCYLHYGDIHTSMRSYVDVSAEYADIPKLDISLTHISTKAILRDGDVVFVDASEDDEGTSKYRVVINPDDIPYISGLHTIVAKEKPGCRLKRSFRKYCFQSRYIKVQFLFYATGIKVSGVSKPNIAKIFVVYPPIPAEQEAIASALGDADALIESLERLIAKKRAIKQGTMQEILTARRRLPGFKGEWENKQLGEIGEISGSGVDKKSRPDEVALRLVNYMDVARKDFIYSRDLGHWVTAPMAQARRCAVQKGDIFFTPSSETRENIGLAAVAMEDIPDATYSYHVVRLRLWADWDLRFRAYAFMTRGFLSQTEMYCDGSGTRYVLSQSKFRKLTVFVPADKDEQAAIATVLSDMDAEITALEGKLAKARAIKQGMMQELLTGRIRLV